MLAAKNRAEALGNHTVVLSSSIEGEARRVAIDHMLMAKDARLHRPACIISGGETTVTLQGDGMGGRTNNSPSPQLSKLTA